MRFIIPAVLIGFFGLVALGILASGAYWNTYERAEPQPIAFPHDIHAGKLNLACTHCHVYVEKSLRAGAPAVQICINCHGNAPSQSPEVDKLKEYWANQQPIEWVRIHKLLDHVYFSHKRHIKANIDCAVCHGDMTVVKTVKKVRTLQMGFCLSCHRANAAPQQCSTCHK